MFRRRHKIILLNERWETISEHRVYVEPRANELVFLPETEKYYEVLNVVHYLNKKDVIFVIIKEFVQPK